MCGVVGIYQHHEAANLAYLGLYALQHRGQESAGIVASDGSALRAFRGMGLVPDIVTPDIIEQLSGHVAIGHVRYSTSGHSELKNAQPFVVNYAEGALGVAHNGNFTNAQQLRSKLEKEGAIFQSTMDTEVIMHRIARSKKSDLVNKIQESLDGMIGAYSLLFMTEDKMVAVRDPKGFRPLLIGKLNGGYIVASETSAFDLIDAEFIRSVEPGEIILFENNEMKSFALHEQSQKKAHCIFEYIYFARPDSHIYGRDVYDMRKGFGRQLAREHAVDADIVIPVPDSGVPAAIGYAEESGIPFEMGLIRNHYVGRTFIEPENSIRHFGVKIKLNPVRELLEGKRVVVVDDSLVRGTTSMKIVKMLREKGGAKEIHLRISSPPIAWPCFYGIDTPTREELIGAKASIEEIQKYVDADSLGYLSFEGLYWFEKKKQQGEWFCDACFTGRYPVSLQDAPHIEEEAKKFLQLPAASSF